MTQRSPLVIVDGRLSQLAPGDSIQGATAGTLTTASGLIGGGDLNTGTKRVDVALTSNPSGIVFAGDKLSYDGDALAVAFTAGVSGSAALSGSYTALASGDAAVEFAEQALATGVLAQSEASQATSSTNVVVLVAGSDLDLNSPVGINAAGQAEKIIQVSGSSTGIAIGSTPLAVTPATADYLAIDGSDKRNEGYLFYEYTGPAYARRFEVIGGETNSVVLGPEVRVSSGNGAYLDARYNQRDERMYCSWRDSSTLNYTADRLLYASGGLESDGSQSLVTDMGPIRNTDNYVSTYRHVTYFPNYNKQGLYVTDGTFEYQYSYTNLTEMGGTKSGIYTLDSLDDKKVGTSDIRWAGHSYIPTLGSGMLVYADTGNSNYLTAGIDWMLDQFSNVNSFVATGIYDIPVDPNVAGQAEHISTCYIPTIDRVLCTYVSYNVANDPGHSYILEASGVTVNKGDRIQFNATPNNPSGNVDDTSVVWNNYEQKATVTFVGHSSNYLMARTGVPSGSTTSGQYNLAWTSPVYVLSSNNHTQVKSWYSETAERVVVIAQNSSVGKAEIRVLPCEVYSDYSALNGTNQNNFLGLSTSAVSSGDTVTIALSPSTITTFSGLDTGRFYYLDAVSGQLTTEPKNAHSWSGAFQDDWKPVGKALSPTDLFLSDSL